MISWGGKIGTSSLPAWSTLRFFTVRFISGLHGNVTHLSSPSQEAQTKNPALVSIAILARVPFIVSTVMVANRCVWQCVRKEKKETEGITRASYLTVFLGRVDSENLD